MWTLVDLSCGVAMVSHACASVSLGGRGLKQRARQATELGATQGFLLVGASLANARSWLVKPPATIPQEPSMGALTEGGIKLQERLANQVHCISSCVGMARWALLGIEHGSGPACLHVTSLSVRWSVVTLRRLPHTSAASQGCPSHAFALSQHDHRRRRLSGLRQV